MSDLYERLYARIEDDDLVSVVSCGSSGGYDWTSLEAFYSPSRRRFFWISGSGCSCNHLGENVRSIADLEDGDRAALVRAIDSFYGYFDWIDSSDKSREVSIVRDFEEVSA